MKLQFIILSWSFLLITVFSYPLDTSIVSLEMGNKWYYHYVYFHSLYGTVNKLETKEVIGDTLIDYNEYKIIQVKTFGTDTTSRLQYWGVDSVKFYFKNLEIVNWRLDTFYDIRIFNDTVFFYSGGFPTEEYGMKLDTFNIWNETKNTQNWYQYTDYLVSHYSSYIHTVFGIGPVEIRSYNSNEYETQIKTNTLVGALIDGILYGDSIITDVFGTYKFVLINYSLAQNYPNPFNPTTTIKFTISDLPAGRQGLQFTTLKVYDILGNEVATLVKQEKPAGEYEVEFDGIDLPSGIYFYQLRAGNYVETKKMVLLK